jgi:hypothetical protein
MFMGFPACKDQGRGQRETSKEESVLLARDEGTCFILIMV